MRGELPPGVKGEYGPELKALLRVAEVRGRDQPTTDPRVRGALRRGDLAPPLSNIVRDAAELFHGEKEEIFRAGLAATTYQHIDDTLPGWGASFGTRISSAIRFTRPILQHRTKTD